jgi:hypothetical protein
MERISSLTNAAALTMALWFLAGCASPSHLVFYQSTILGVDVATTTQGGTVHATLGYDRQTTTFIPKSRVKNDQQVDENEAMSAIARLTVKIQWLGIQEIHEQFATGQAARNIARRPEALEALMQPPDTHR